MRKGHLQYILLKPFYERAAKKMCKEFGSYILDSKNVLDLGCGSGIVAKQIENDLNLKVKGIDIVDMRVVDISFKKYDGKDLSFISDNEFDTVLISYVLHHTGNPKDILRQAKRIAGENVIIYEDMNEGFLGKIYCKIHGRLFDLFFLRNSVPAKFYSEKEWDDVFKELGLKIVYSKDKKIFLNPVRRKLFVLEKEGV